MHFEALCSVPALSVQKRGSSTKTAIARISNMRAVRKTLLIMKLTAILLLAACLQLSAKVHSQNVTLSLKDASLKNVLKEISRQTGYYFIYKDEWMAHSKKVDIQVNDAPLEQALGICFKNQPFTYMIIENNVVLKPKVAFKIDEPAEKPEPRADIRGVITGDNNLPVAGANVLIKRNGRGTTTKGNGEFRLSDVNDDDILIIAAMGYERKEVAVKE